MLKAILSTMSQTVRSSALFHPSALRRRKSLRGMEIDSLESRLLMTARVWDGGGGAANTNWSNRFNWSGDLAPVNGDDLVFPNTAPNRTAKNDFAAGTRTFASISMADGNGGGGYNLIGNGIRLTGGITAVSVNGFQHNIDARVDFVGTISHSISVGDQSLLTLNSPVSSTAGFSAPGALTKAGTGRLILAGSNTFSSQFTVQAGIVQMANKNAFGTSAGSTSVLPGAAIHLEEFIGAGEEFPRDLTNAEPLLLQGTGINATGALRNVSGNNRWNGTVTLGGRSVAAIGVDGTNGEFSVDELTINGVIKGGATSNLQKRGVGRLHVSGNNTYLGTTLIEQGVVRMRSSTALGSTAGLTRVESGAALELDDVEIGGGEVIPLIVNERLELMGTGVGSTGALRNVQGLNTWAGTVALLATSTARVDQSSDVLSITGLISGARAGLSMTGPGELLLTANNTYSGMTTVVSGKLTVNGIQPSSSVLVNGGTLQGIGTVGATTVQGAGTISPAGNGIGTINVKGNFTAKGTIRIDVSPSTNDRINVTGAVNMVTAPIIVSGTTGATQLGIVQNDLADAVQGSTNGAQVTSSSGQQFLISYTGGTGNDVFLNRTNVAPMFANRRVTAEINEGDDVILSGTIVDPDALDQFFLSIDWGDGQTTQRAFGPGASRNVYLAHNYIEQDNYKIHLTWTDPSRQGNSGDLQTVVRNVDPTVQAGNTAFVDVNSVFQRRLQLVDPGADSFTVLVDYGDGSAMETLTPGRSKSLSLSHRFTRAGAYRVTVQVLDDDGGIGTDSLFVIVT